MTCERAYAIHYADLHSLAKWLNGSGHRSGSRGYVRKTASSSNIANTSNTTNATYNFSASYYDGRRMAKHVEVVSRRASPVSVLVSPLSAPINHVSEIATSANTKALTGLMSPPATPIIRWSTSNGHRSKRVSKC